MPPAGWAGAAGTASPVGSAGRAGHVGWAGSPKKAGNSEIPDEHCPAVDTWHRERAPGFRPSSANWPGDAGGSHCPSLQGQRECPLIVTRAFQTHKGEGDRTSVRGASVHLLAALPKPRGHLGTSTSSPLISNMSQVSVQGRGPARVVCGDGDGALATSTPATRTCSWTRDSPGRGRRWMPEQGGLAFPRRGTGLRGSWPSDWTLANLS